MNYYKLKPRTGSHVEDGINYKSGDVVPSKSNLAAIFPCKFDEVVGPPAAMTATKPKVDEPPNIAIDDEDYELDDELPVGFIKSILGKNVTMQFSFASKTDFLILKSGTQYLVADRGMPDRPIAKGMNKKVMQAWLAENK